MPWTVSVHPNHIQHDSVASGTRKRSSQHQSQTGNSSGPSQPEDRPMCPNPMASHVAENALGKSSEGSGSPDGINNSGSGLPQHPSTSQNCQQVGGPLEGSLTLNPELPSGSLDPPVA